MPDRQTVISRAREVREVLARRVLVADGAMGTMLYGRGVFINRCFDELNLAQPDLVKDVHQEYVKAGAEIIETNTFGANRLRLAAFGVADKLVAINQRGRAAGPRGRRRERLRRRRHRAARRQDRTARPPLVRRDPRHLPRAGGGARRGRHRPRRARDVPRHQRAEGGRATPCARPPATTSSSSPRSPSTKKGTCQRAATPTAFTARLDEMPVDVIGLNCSVGPKAMLDTLERMAQLTAKPLSVMPNAGNPVSVEGRNIYLCSPEYMAQYARRYVQLGVKVIGGCCGTTPAHIKEIRSEVRSLQPGVRQIAVTAHEVQDAREQDGARAHRAQVTAGREARRRRVRHLRRDPAATRRRRVARDRRRPAVPQRRHRRHQRARRPARLGAHVGAGDLPEDPGSESTSRPSSTSAAATATSCRSSRSCSARTSPASAT